MNRNINTDEKRAEQSFLFMYDIILLHFFVEEKQVEPFDKCIHNF